MPIQTLTQRNSLAAAYGAAAVFGAAYITVPGASAGTEPTGGSPAYARRPLTWGAPSASAVTATATFDVPSGATLVGAGCHTAVTAGTYLDGAAVASQAFASQGTYLAAYTYTQA
jgi:hypothetical protein